MGLATPLHYTIIMLSVIYEANIVSMSSETTYHHTSYLVDRLTADELEKVADTLCEDTEVKNLGDFMGISANEVKQLVKHHKKRSLVDKLREQQERSECCTKKCFAVGLMKAGCYRQSLTLEPGCK